MSPGLQDQSVGQCSRDQRVVKVFSELRPRELNGESQATQLEFVIDTHEQLTYSGPVDPELDLRPHIRWAFMVDDGPLDLEAESNLTDCRRSTL